MRNRFPVLALAGLFVVLCASGPVPPTWASAQHALPSKQEQSPSIQEVPTSTSGPPPPASGSQPSASEPQPSTPGSPPSTSVPALSAPPEHAQSTGKPTSASTESAQAMPAFPALPGILEDYRALRVGDAFDAAGKEFRIGHMRMDFRSGSFYAILTHSGKEAGFIYEGGEGHYTYTTEDAGDLQTIEKNIVSNVSTNAYRDG